MLVGQAGGLVLGEGLVLGDTGMKSGLLRSMVGADFLLLEGGLG